MKTLLRSPLFWSALVIVGGIALYAWSMGNLGQFGSPKSTVQINDTMVVVELADTSAAREQGLSGRSALPSGTGMLFLFPSRNIYPFWMKDMKFSIDVIWIDDDTVVDIEKNTPIPDPGTPLRDLPLYTPNAPADKVLEVTAGTLEVEIGDKVVF